MMIGHNGKVIVIGGGGREHALSWKFANSGYFTEVFIAPGNAGTSDCTNLNLDVSNVNEIKRAVEENAIDLVVFGPELPLSNGFADNLRDAGIKVFGPGASATRLESSKVWSKNFMKRHKIPTAEFTVVKSVAATDEFFQNNNPAEFVLKADGLAAGKGVILPDSAKDAAVAARTLFDNGHSALVIERRLNGRECSVFALVSDGNFSELVAACDYKKLNDADTGPNTGGMGCYALPEFWTAELSAKIKHAVFEKTVKGLQMEHLNYRGVLYAGIMLGENGDVNLLEFNVRFGDPECQILMPLLNDDVSESICQTACGELAQNRPIINDLTKSSVGVVIASKGYPQKFEVNIEIPPFTEIAGTKVFHSSTKRATDGKILTNGGRVLTAVGIGDDLPTAHKRVYETVGKINFKNSYHRTDIALRAVGKEIKK